jgi:glycosyltransferase involved in cell wall biosynthesis
MVRILTMATTFPRWEGDSEATFVKDLCDSLVEQGHEQYVLVPHSKGILKHEKVGSLDITRFVYFLPHSFENLAYGGMLPNIKKDPKRALLAPFLFISEFMGASRLCRKHDIDVIHSHWAIPSGFVGALLRKFTGRKHIMTIHAADIFALEKLPIGRAFINFIVKNTDCITVVSTHGRDFLLKLVSPKYVSMVQGKTTILSMGTHTKNFIKRKSRAETMKGLGLKEGFNILFLGRLAEKKGAEFLILALRPLLLHRKNINLIIVGDGPLRERLEMLATKLNINHYIRFEGYKSGDEKYRYFTVADVMVVPSIVTKEGDTEGLPVTIMEGMAAGIPVIATDVGGTRDILHDNINGILIEEKKPEQIADAIIRLMEDDKLRKRLSEGALLTGKQYDWKSISKGYSDLINNVVDSR